VREMNRPGGSVFAQSAIQGRKKNLLHTQGLREQQQQPAVSRSAR